MRNLSFGLSSQTSQFSQFSASARLLRFLHAALASKNGFVLQYRHRSELQVFSNQTTMNQRVVRTENPRADVPNASVEKYVYL